MAQLLVLQTTEIILSLLISKTTTTTTKESSEAVSSESGDNRIYFYDDFYYGRIWDLAVFFWITHHTSDGANAGDEKKFINKLINISDLFK